MSLRDLVVSVLFQDNASGGLNDINNNATGLGKVLVGVAATLGGIFALGKMKDLATDMVAAAGEAEALNAQFETVFDTLQDDANASINVMADEFGMLPSRLSPTLTKITSMFKGFGMSTEDSMEASAVAVELAADAAAFYDVAMSDSTGALTSFLKGNTNAAESIGIFATAAGMASFASDELGLNWKKLDEGGKQLVRLKYIESMQDAAGATGQAARESDGYENVLGNLQQAWIDLKSKLGMAIFDEAITGMKMVATWMSSINTDAIVEKFQSLKSYISATFGPTFNQLKDNATTAIGLIVDKAKEFAGIIKDNWEPIKETVIGLGIAVLAFRGIMSSMSIIGTVTALVRSYRAGTLAATHAQAALNLAILTSPILWITVGIAALIGVIVYLVRNFDWARDAFDATWSFLKSSFSAVMEWMKPYAASAMAVVMDTFNSVKNYVMEVMPMILTIIQTVWSVIAPLFSFYGTLISTYVSIAFTTIKNIVSLVFTSISTIIQTVWTVISGIFKTALQLLTGDFSGAWETMKETAIGAIAGLVTLFEGFISGAMKIGSDFVQGIINGFLAVWDSLKETAGKIWDSVTSIFDKKKTIDVGINAKTTGGTGVDGSHATGLASVPKNNYLANLHQGESVLTASQSNMMRQSGMLTAKSDGTPKLKLGGGTSAAPTSSSTAPPIVINISGDNAKDIAAEVRREVENIFTGLNAGIA